MIYGDLTNILYNVRREAHIKTDTASICYTYILMIGKSLFIIVIHRLLDSNKVVEAVGEGFGQDVGVVGEAVLVVPNGLVTQEQQIGWVVPGRNTVNLGLYGYLVAVFEERRQDIFPFTTDDHSVVKYIGV